VITARTPASRWQLLLLGLGVILFGTQLFALDPTRTVFQYNIQTWNRQNGLPFNRISSIVQTPDGYLWMGTQNGLVRFDGVEFSRTAIPNRVGWRSTSVASLRPSPRGGFWFGLDEGAVG
jgi:ligand-binding sensor domain-containing protein